MSTIDTLEKKLGIRFQDCQLEAIDKAFRDALLETPRVCLYYKTGAGKSITSMACLNAWGCKRALVIAPPSTHADWQALGERIGINVECMSHAKFRMKSTKLARDVPVIADEFHLFGGHNGQGWQKLDRLSAGLKAPLILLSATPNYNDAERVYCVHHVMAPNEVKGGFLEFLHQNCLTQMNPFSMTPDILGFIKYQNAAEYLSDQHFVMYLPDDLVYTIEEVEYVVAMPRAYEDYGYNAREHRVVASQIEDRHTRALQGLVSPDKGIYPEILDKLAPLLDVDGEAPPVLIYANHSTIALALWYSLAAHGPDLVTGKTTKKNKAKAIKKFNAGETNILIGTASLATGTDGMDKVCDLLIILDDTDDDSLRRQLIGRIMPRGLDTDASNKRVVRFKPV